MSTTVSSTKKVAVIVKPILEKGFMNRREITEKWHHKAIGGNIQVLVAEILGQTESLVSKLLLWKRTSSPGGGQISRYERLAISFPLCILGVPG